MTARISGVMGNAGPDAGSGSFCGDGIVQKPQEDCDPGSDTTCPNSCHRLMIK